jgi:hypothetical protein
MSPLDRRAKSKCLVSSRIFRVILLLVILRSFSFSYFYGLSSEVFPGPGVMQAVTRSGPRDMRPIAKKGLLCVDQTQGRLNNIIIQLLVMLHMGMAINRTVLITGNMASAFESYDFEHFNLNFQLGQERSSFKPFLVDPRIRECYNGTATSSGGMSIANRIRQFDQKTLLEPVATLAKKSSWYFLGRPKPPFYVDFFSVLQPTKAIGNKVDDFIKRTFQGKPFVAVHLRNLEGACKGMTESLELCCPTRDTVVKILHGKGMSSHMPIFVANDRQCPDQVIEEYRKHGDILGFSGECEHSECPVLDFEICIHAALFVGTLASTADMNIREMRTERMKLPGGASVLSLKEQTLRNENVTALTRNWIPGAFRWIRDCEKRKNKFPCV